MAGLATDRERARLMGIRGAARRYGRPEPADLAGRLWLARCRRELDRLVDDRPDLTDGQKAELAELLAEELARSRVSREVGQ